MFSKIHRKQESNKPKSNLAGNFKFFRSVSCCFGFSSLPKEPVEQEIKDEKLVDYIKEAIIILPVDICRIVAVYSICNEKKYTNHSPNENETSETYEELGIYYRGGLIVPN